MIRILVFLSLSALILTLNPGRAPSQKAPKANEDIFGHERFCVTIWPEKTQIEGDEFFEVKLRVVNSSERIQSFEVMNCSWDEHWQCSNPLISHETWVCCKNFAVSVQLQPGEAYEQKSIMCVGTKDTSRTLSFRMGFTPIGEKKTYWSNEVVLGLK